MNNLLVSFCGTTEPYLGQINLDTGEKTYAALELQDIKGITGLVVANEYILASVQTYGGALAVLDKQTLGVLSLQPIGALDRINDVHSILVANNLLYIVSTGTDEILIYDYDESFTITNPRILWRPVLDRPRGDFNHLTSICMLEGNLYVAAFGRKETPEQGDWMTAMNGYIHNVSQDVSVLSGIQHPHSVSVFDSSFMYCESIPGIVHLPGKQYQTTGYPRGLCVVGSSLYVGISVHRDGTGECKVVKLDSDTLEVQGEYPFGEHGTEIYDIIHVV